MASGFQGFTDTSLSHQAKPLPVTSGKTPAGSGPKPPAKKAPAKAPASPPAAASLADPQMTALLAQQAQQRQAIQDATRQYLGMLQAQPNVQNDYANAAGQIGGLGAAAAQFLQGQNPNPQIQHDLAHVGGGQAAQIAAALGNAFNGGAGALFAQHALVPGTLLAENGAAAAALQKSQAPNVALQGLNSLRQANYDSTQALQNLKTSSASGGASGLKYFSSGGNEYVVGADGKVVKLTNNPSTSDFRQQQLDLSRQRLGLSAQETSARLNLSQQQFSQRQRQQQSQFVQRQRVQIAKYNATQAAADRKLALPSASLSQKLGYLADASGQPILNAKGQRQVLPGFKVTKGQIVPRSKSSSSVAPNGIKVPTGAEISKMVDSFKNGKPVNVRSQVGTKVDSQGNKLPVYGSTTQASGKLQYNQAYSRLKAMGIDDKSARQYLDTAYQKGEQGRGWLTNEQRRALKKAGRQNYVGYYKGHAYIALSQAHALQKAGLLPAGETVNGRYFIAPGY